MRFNRTDLWISLEPKRGSRDGLNLRVSARCEKCSRHCIISSSVQSGFPSAYVDRLVAVFSSLCEKLEEIPDVGVLVGPPNLSSDVSEE